MCFHTCLKKCVICIYKGGRCFTSKYIKKKGAYTNIFVFQEHSVVKKRSVAELAGKFSCPISHMTDAEVVRFHIIRI